MQLINLDIESAISKNIEIVCLYIKKITEIVFLITQMIVQWYGMLVCFGKVDFTYPYGFGILMLYDLLWKGKVSYYIHHEYLVNNSEVLLKKIK